MSTPLGTTTLANLWHRAAAEFADRPAVAMGEASRWASYREIDQVSQTIAQDLLGHGLRPGETVVLAVTRGPVWMPLMIAVWACHGVVVPHTERTEESIVAAAALCGARLVVVDADTPHTFGYRIRPTTEPVGSQTSLGSEHAYAMHTSGSTGAPKLVVVSHNTSVAILQGLASVVGITPDEHALHTAAFSFSSSIRQLMVPLISGARLSILTRPRFDARHTLELCAHRDVTSLDLTPSHLAAVTAHLEADSDCPVPKSLRRVMIASEALPPQLLSRWRTVCPHPHSLVHLYGLTETGGAFSALVDADHHTDPDGPIPLTLPFAPFRATFTPTADPDTGELVLHGTDPRDGLLSQGQFRPHLDHRAAPGAGFATGDLFYVHTDGRLTYRGRADQQVKILGQRVDLAVVENIVNALPGVAQAATATIERPGGGTLVAVGYVPASSDRGLPDDIAVALATRLPAGIPGPFVQDLAALPLTRTGKIDRPALTEMLQDRLVAATTGGRDVLEQIWARHTVHSPHRDEPQVPDFFAAGGDSVSMIGLLADIATAIGQTVLPEQFYTDPTLDGLRALIHTSTDVASPSDPPPHATCTPSAVAASDTQQGIWISEQLRDAEVSPYWLPVDLEIDSALDRDRLTRAWQQVVEQFDALRLQFDVSSTRLAAAAHPLIPTDIFDTAPADLGSITDNEGLARLFVEQHSKSTVLSLRVHHAVADRPSLELILAALCTAYDRRSQDSPAAAESSFLEWLHIADARANNPSAVAAAAEYWHAVLPEPEPRTTTAHHPRIERVRVTLTASPAQRTATAHSRWLWALRCALTDLGQPQPGVIGIDIDTRTPDHRKLVGSCVITRPVVLAEREGDFESGARAAGLAVATLLPHAPVPLSATVNVARRPTGDPRQPYFLHNLVYQRAAFAPLRLNGMTLRYTRLPAGIAENTTTLFVRETTATADLELAFDRTRLDRAEAKELLETVVRHICGQRVTADDEDPS